MYSVQRGKQPWICILMHASVTQCNVVEFQEGKTHSVNIVFSEKKTSVTYLRLCYLEEKKKL